MGIEIRECEAKDFPQIGVSDTLEERWEFVLAVPQECKLQGCILQVGRNCVVGPVQLWGRDRLPSLIYRRIIDFISGSAYAKKSPSSWPDCLIIFTTFFVVVLEMIWLLPHLLIAH